MATLAWSAVSAQAQSETFSGTASLKTAGGVNANAPVTITIDRFATDADQAALVAAAKSGGTAARDWLAKRADAGSLQVGGRKMPIKYAYVRKTAGGRLITVATAEPIALVGAGLPDAKSSAGFDLGFVLLDMPASGAGQGELSPAAKVSVNQQGAIVTEDFNKAGVVHVSNIVKK
ncbi:MAG TPA: hypothetical protein VFV95_08965 [Vicinamibacterales bacterium]|nr:hypothetical protein [Vicinamibacterales bacterium]